MTARKDPNKVTFGHVDNLLFGGALSGVGDIAKNLVGAAGERATTYAVYGMTGAMYGFGSEHQRTAAMVSKYRPTTPGQVVGGAVDHPANVIQVGEPVKITLGAPDAWVVDGVVYDMDDECIALDNEHDTFRWDEVERIEAEGGVVWTCYEGDNAWHYEIPASRLR